MIANQFITTIQIRIIIATSITIKCGGCGRLHRGLLTRANATSGLIKASLATVSALWVVTTPPQLRNSLIRHRFTHSGIPSLPTTTDSAFRPRIWHSGVWHSGLHLSGFPRTCPLLGPLSSIQADFQKLAVCPVFASIHKYAWTLRPYVRQCLNVATVRTSLFWYRGST